VANLVAGAFAIEDHSALGHEEENGIDCTADWLDRSKRESDNRFFWNGKTATSWLMIHFEPRLIVLKVGSEVVLSRPLWNPHVYQDPVLH